MSARRLPNGWGSVIGCDRCDEQSRTAQQFVKHHAAYLKGKKWHVGRRRHLCPTHAKELEVERAAAAAARAEARRLKHERAKERLRRPLLTREQKREARNKRRRERRAAARAAIQSEAAP